MKAYLAQEDGQAMVEYALLFAALLLTAFVVFGGGVAEEIKKIYDLIAKNLTKVSESI